MDWLFVNDILIDCSKKKLLFASSKELELLSSKQLLKEDREKSKCFIILTHLDVEKGDGGVDIPIMKEFGDVFLMKYKGCLLKEKWSSQLTWYQVQGQYQ